MMVSPFTFYRGSAKIMAADLKDTPTAGLEVQLCGDAHLSNFGSFASPERTLLFDLNDFDETLPGPFEYDVKRLAASVTIAARNNGLTDDDARVASLASATAYREAMARFAEMRTMEIWYSRVVGAGSARGRSTVSSSSLKGADKKRAEAVEKSARKRVEKAHTRDSLQALSKLAEHVDGRYRIVSQPPVVVPMRDLAASHGYSVQELEHLVHEQFRAYRATLRDDRRHLLEQFQVLDMARKVVGVGASAAGVHRAVAGPGRGRPAVPAGQGGDRVRAGGSPAEEPVPAPGERVVQGQRLMQAASDIFLGWTKGREANRYLYWRQLRDMKGSAEVEAMDPTLLADYAAVLRPDAGPRPRPLRRSGRDRGLPRQEGWLRPVDRRLRAALRRPERAGLRSLPGKRSDRADCKPSKAPDGPVA